MVFTAAAVVLSPACGICSCSGFFLLALTHPVQLVGLLGILPEFRVGVSEQERRQGAGCPRTRHECARAACKRDRKLSLVSFSEGEKISKRALFVTVFRRRTGQKPNRPSSWSERRQATYFRFVGGASASRTPRCCVVVAVLADVFFPVAPLRTLATYGFGFVLTRKRRLRETQNEAEKCCVTFSPDARGSERVCD